MIAKNRLGPEWELVLRDFIYGNDILGTYRMRCQEHIKELIQTGSIEGLIQYSQRLTIKGTYPPIKTNHLRISGIKSNQLHLLDINDCLKNINLNIRRLRGTENNLLLIQNELKPKYKQEYIQVKKYFIQNNDLVYSEAQPYTMPELIQELEQSKDISFHEVISRQDVRLFMELDNNRVALDWLVSNVELRINEMGIFSQPLPKCSASQYQYGDVISAHIVWPIIVDIRVQFELFSMIREQLGYDQIDIGVYSIGHTLRLPFCPKVTKVNGICKVDYERVLNADWINFNKYLITSQEESDIVKLNILGDKMVPFVHNSYISDFEKIKEAINTYFKEQRPDIQILQIYEPIQKEKGLCGLIRTDVSQEERKCIVDGRIHTSNPDRTLNYMICNNQISIGCFRSQGHSRITIPCDQCSSEIQIINNTEYNLCQQYLNLELELKKEVVYIIGSMMGTGKTTQIRKLIEQLKEGQGCCVVSTRKTFTSKVVGELNPFKFKSYLDDSGVLDCIYDRYVVQAESIVRIPIQGTNKIPLLILDEFVSILLQINSNIEVLGHLLELIKKAQCILFCDHSINPQLIEYIKTLVNTRQINVYMNSFQPQQGNQFKIIRIGKHNKNQIISPELVQAFDESLKNRPSHQSMVVGYISSYTMASEVSNQLINKGYNVRIYHGKNLETETIDQQVTTHFSVKNEHFKDVNANFQLYNCIIYTGTITVGISFDLNLVYKAINYIAPQTGTAVSHLQAMHRFRHLKDQTLYLDSDLMDASRTAFSQQDYFISRYQKNLLLLFQRQFAHINAYVSCILYLGSHWLINELKRLGYNIIEDSLDKPQVIQKSQSIPLLECQLIEKEFFKCNPQDFQQFVDHWNQYGRYKDQQGYYSNAKQNYRAFDKWIWIYMREKNKQISQGINTDDFIKFIKDLQEMMKDKNYKHTLKCIEQRDRQRVDYDKVINDFYREGASGDAELIKACYKIQTKYRKAFGERDIKTITAQEAVHFVRNGKFKGYHTYLVYHYLGYSYMSCRQQVNGIQKRFSILSVLSELLSKNNYYEVYEQ